MRRDVQIQMRRRVGIARQIAKRAVGNANADIAGGGRGVVRAVFGIADFGEIFEDAAVERDIRGVKVLHRLA